MSPSVLLIVSATKWLGAERMPHDLVQAGWTVSLLAPKGSLAERSRAVQKIGHLPDPCSLNQWIYAFAAMVEATHPRLVLPCDDTSFRILQELVLAPPEHMRPARQLKLAELIAESLGDPAHYRASVDKTLFSEAAQAMGVRVPPFAVVGDAAEAQSFAAAHGWPIVLKRGQSSAGDGVAICADQEALAAQFARLARESEIAGPGEAARLLVQAYIQGRTQYFAGTAWQGSLVCGYAVDRLEGGPQGPASVVRYFHSPELEVSTAKLAAGFGATGIFAPEYILDERSGESYLLEINRRITPGTHRGEFIRVSTADALLAMVEGRPLRTRPRLDPGEERVFVAFPHEWLRDPQSRFLRNHPVDAPWDDPELLKAIVARVIEGAAN